MYKRKDAYHARAKADGYRSRAAYKLVELVRRYRMIRAEDRVVDLGAWPGGWLQVAAEFVGSKGVVIGVDVTPIDPLPGGTVAVILGDAGDPAVQAEIARRLGGGADVVLSDMAPKLTGVRATDEQRGVALATVALQVADGTLRPGGAMILKVFMNPATEQVVAEVRRRFVDVRVTRPDASRSGSAELYVVARRFRGGPGPVAGGDTGPNSPVK